MEAAKCRLCGGRHWGLCPTITEHESAPKGAVLKARQQGMTAATHHVAGGGKMVGEVPAEIVKPRDGGPSTAVVQPDEIEFTPRVLRAAEAACFDVAYSEGLVKAVVNAVLRERRAEIGDNIEKQKPWVAEGISRRTWYRREADRRKQGAGGEG